LRIPFCTIQLATMLFKSIVISSVLGFAAASSPQDFSACVTTRASVNVTGTVASDNFYQSCQEQLLVKGSGITAMAQCTRGRSILSAFEATKCADGPVPNHDCDCDTEEKIKCTEKVAKCAAICVDSLGVACAQCVGKLDAKCCRCACDAFGCSCDKDCPPKEL